MSIAATIKAATTPTTPEFIQIDCEHRHTLFNVHADMLEASVILDVHQLRPAGSGRIFTFSRSETITASDARDLAVALNRMANRLDSRVPAPF